MARLALLAVLALSLPALAQTTRPTTQPIDPAAVSALVGQLGADDPAERDAARQKLLSMGLGVSGHLEKALESATDPEVRTSLAAIIADLPKYDRSVPTLVTIKLTGVPAKQALDAVMEQTGVPYDVPHPEFWRHSRFKDVTLDADRKPYWVVMSDICAQAGLTPQNHNPYNRNVITIGHGNPRKVGPVWFDERGFYVTALNATRTHHIDYEAPGRPQETFGLNFRILVDPRITVTRGSNVLLVTEALDEKGNSLLPKTPGMSLEDMLRNPSWDGTWLWDSHVNLTYLPEQGKLLKSFKAKAVFEIAEKKQTWEVDLAKADKAETTLLDTQVTIDSVTKDGEGCEVKLSLKWAEPLIKFGRRQSQHHPLRQYHTIQSAIQVVDDKGTPLRRFGGGGSSGGGKASFSFRFSRSGRDTVGEPAKLILTVPTETRTVELPIEFKDLPIP